MTSVDEVKKYLCKVTQVSAYLRQSKRPEMQGLIHE